jgi:hypothetical protein
MKNEIVRRADTLVESLARLVEGVSKLAEAGEALDPLVSVAAGEPWDLFRSRVEETKTSGAELLDEAYTLAIDLAAAEKAEARRRAAHDVPLAEKRLAQADNLADNLARLAHSLVPLPKTDALRQIEEFVRALLNQSKQLTHHLDAYAARDNPRDYLAEEHAALLGHLAELERRPVIGAELRRLRCLGELPWDW